MDAKRKADYTAVALQSKKPRHELVVHGGEKGGLVQSVSYYFIFHFFVFPQPYYCCCKSFGLVSYE